MRILPIALIVVGMLGVAKYFGLIPVGMAHLIGPFLLIALGVALLLRRPRRCHDDRHARRGVGSTTALQPASPALDRDPA